MSELNSADQEIMRLATEAEPEGTPEATPEAKVEAKEPLELGGEEAPEATEAEVEGDEKRKGRSHSPIKRIGQLTAEKHELRRQLEEERAKNAGAVTPQLPSVEEIAAKKPDPQNFEYGIADPDYTEAITDWKLDLRDAQKHAKQQQEKQAEAQSVEQSATIEKLFESRAKMVKDGAEKYDDFEAKIVEAGEARGEPLHPLISIGTQVSPVGADVLYQLATDNETTEKLEGLAQTDPKRAAMMFGELEAQYLDNDDDTDLNLNDPWDDLRQRGRDRARRKGLSKSVERKTSKAPEPPENRARGAGGKFEVGDDSEDFAAFERKIMGKG